MRKDRRVVWPGRSEGKGTVDGLRAKVKAQRQPQTGSIDLWKKIREDASPPRKVYVNPVIPRRVLIGLFQSLNQTQTASHTSHCRPWWTVLLPVSLLDEATHLPCTTAPALDPAPQSSSQQLQHSAKTGSVQTPHKRAHTLQTSCYTLACCCPLHTGYNAVSRGRTLG